MNERIRKILEWTKGPSVLDLGCVGSSLNPDSLYWLHRHLVEKFPRVIGLDINQDALTKLKEMGFNCVLGNAENFQIEEQFDTIVAGELIEHLSNPGRFLETARKHLSPDGRLIITTPYPFSLMHIAYAFLKYPKTCSNPEHTMWFCPTVFMELVKRHNYTIRHWELIEDYYHGVGSFFYRLFVRLRWLIPTKRLRCNAILFVLEPR